MILGLLVLVIIGKYGCTEGFELPFEKHIKIENIFNCRQYPNLPMYFEKIGIKQVNRRRFLVGKFVITRNSRPQLKMEMEVERCTSKEDLNSCEYYNTLRFKNFCQLATRKDQLWSLIWSSYQPALQCPFQKGTYVSRNGTFDANIYPLLIVRHFLWKSRVKLYEVYENETLIMCTYMELQLIDA